MTNKNRTILAAAIAAIVVIAVILGITQPWKKEEAPVDPQPQEQNEAKPQEEYFITVGGEKLPCEKYERDGWSILVPVGWTIEGRTMWPDREKSPDTWLRVEPVDDVNAYEGDFSSLWDKEEGKGRAYYLGAAKRRFQVSYQASPLEWATYERVLEALARTFRVEDQEVLAGFSMTEAPDTMQENGKTILFLDKEGVPVNDYVQSAVKDHMLTWTQEDRAAYTGAYRLDGSVEWAASYTMGHGRYYEIFSAKAAYELAPVQEGETPPTGEDIRDGWRYEPLLLAICHDGYDVLETRPLWDMDPDVGTYRFVPRLSAPAAREMSLVELQDLGDWFNLPDNNGLLRFPFSDGRDPERIGPKLDILFYDLGDTGEAIPKAEREACEKAGVVLETDLFKRSRSFVVGYLEDKLNMAPADIEAMLERHGDRLGTYLKEYDAWYNVHSDTEMQVYTFLEGSVESSGVCVVTCEAHNIQLSSNVSDVLCEVTVLPSAKTPGQWVVLSNKIVG